MSIVHNSIPNFDLYGDDPVGASAEAGHIETIAARSALYDWEISPHRHLQILQVLLVASGQVEYRCDGATRLLDAPCYMVVPIGSVHGFRFSPETTGYVLSLSAGFTGRARNSGDPLLRIFSRGASGPVSSADWPRLEWLAAELLTIQTDWREPPPLFLALAEAFVRSLPVEEEAVRTSGEEGLSGLRRLVELHFREHRSVAWYADRLNTTPKTLTRICRRNFDCTPSHLIHLRLALEAQRLLRFTNANIVQVADALGFADASYFSRFYQRMTGKRPHADKLARQSAQT